MAAARANEATLDCAAPNVIPNFDAEPRELIPATHLCYQPTSTILRARAHG